MKTFTIERWEYYDTRIKYKYRVNGENKEEAINNVEHGIHEDCEMLEQEIDQLVDVDEIWYWEIKEV